VGVPRPRCSRSTPPGNRLGAGRADVAAVRPGLRTVEQGPLMLVYLTDVRGERVVIIQVNWIS
jgi:hypothetical protein